MPNRICRFDDRPIEAIKTKAGDWYRCGRDEEWAYISVVVVNDVNSFFTLQKPWFEVHSHSGRRFERINSDSVARIVYKMFGEES